MTMKTTMMMKTKTMRMKKTKKKMTKKKMTKMKTTRKKKMCLWILTTTSLTSQRYPLSKQPTRCGDVVPLDLLYKQYCLF